MLDGTTTVSSSAHDVSETGEGVEGSVERVGGSEPAPALPSKDGGCGGWWWWWVVVVVVVYNRTYILAETCSRSPGNIEVLGCGHSGSEP